MDYIELHDRIGNEDFFATVSGKMMKYVLSECVNIFSGNFICVENINSSFLPLKPLVNKQNYNSLGVIKKINDIFKEDLTKWNYKIND